MECIPEIKGQILKWWDKYIDTYRSYEVLPFQTRLETTAWVCLINHTAQRILDLKKNPKHYVRIICIKVASLIIHSIPVLWVYDDSELCREENHFKSSRKLLQMSGRVWTWQILCLGSLVIFMMSLMFFSFPVSQRELYQTNLMRWMSSVLTGSGSLSEKVHLEYSAGN